MNIAVTPAGSSGPPTRPSKAASRVKRNKAFGYEVEKQVERALQTVRPDIARTGASAQKTKGYPDLQTPPTYDRHPFLMIATKERGRGGPHLITMTMADFITLCAAGPHTGDWYVQVKGTQKSALLTLWHELKDCVEVIRKRAPAVPNEQQQQQSQARG